MKITVFSDSHGDVESMVTAVRQERPDGIIHLGDCEYDAALLEREFPGMPLYGVCGNCDLQPNSPDRRIFELDGKKIFIAHGHTYRVKLGLESFVNTAMAAGADVAAYGHTHMAMERELDGLLVVNPGSVQDGTYGVLTIENGELHYERKYI